MTYKCIKEFSTEGRSFQYGQTINATEYIALPAKDRRNFMEEGRPLREKNDGWIPFDGNYLLFNKEAKKNCKVT